MSSGIGLVLVHTSILMDSADKKRLQMLLIGIVLVALPFIGQVSMAVILFAGILLLWTVAMLLGKTRWVSRWQRIGLLVLVLLITLAFDGSLLGRQAGTSLLLLLGVLKIFEIKQKRDVYIVIYLQYFLIATSFFYSQSPWVAFYVFGTVTYLVSVQILYNDQLLTISWPIRMKMAARMLLQAIPLMVILFLLFPRIPGPLWGLPSDADTAVTGLSDTMSPGSLSNLIQSGEVAFRARFQSDMPSHSQLYWRGLVFEHYDGKTWSEYKSYYRRAKPELIQAGDYRRDQKIAYTVTLEPHQKRWLFALNYPIDVQQSSYVLTRQLQLLSPKKIRNLTQYSLVSDTALQNRGLFTVEKANNLQLPNELNPQTVALANRWLDEANGDQWQVVQRALRYFNQNEFIYTLNPPKLGEQAMDEFLFNTRRGFCEHYASAFVYLMRAAGIVSRVVVGYQGGEKNPVDDYIVVRQSNAHAWAEVWTPNRGWQQVDPTAAVSPNRIESGIQDAVAERDQLPAIIIEDSWMTQAWHQWDSFNYAWSQWVIGFDGERQRQFLQHLGFENIDWQEMVVGLIILMGGGGMLIAFWVFKQSDGRQSDPIQKAYWHLCNKLAKSGYVRQSNEGPVEYLIRLKGKITVASHRQAEQALQYYLQIRYGQDSSPQIARRFIQAVRNLRIRHVR